VELRVHERQKLISEKEVMHLLCSGTTAKVDMLGNCCLMSCEYFSVETQSGMNAHPCILSASETLGLLLPSSHTAGQERKSCGSETHHPALPSP
jgi:hypothetical protein